MKIWIPWRNPYLFASQTDQIERVRIYTPEENFQMYFTNPDSGENRAYDGAIQEIGRKNMGHMFRILSVENYFKEQDRCEEKTGETSFWSSRWRIPLWKKITGAFS